MGGGRTALDGIRDWVEFFRDIGVDSLYVRRNVSAAALVEAPCDARPRLIFVWDPPAESAARGETDDLLRRMIARLELPPESVCLIEATGSVAPKDEAAARCELETRIRSTGSAVVVAFGAAVSRLLTGSQEGIVELRGRAVERDGYTVIPTYHPTYLLKRPSRRHETWTDLQGALKRSAR